VGSRSREAGLNITRPRSDQRRVLLVRVVRALLNEACHPDRMAELEDHAIQRDKGFVVKLVVALVLGTIAGGWAMYHLTSDRTGEAGAEMFGYPSGTPGPSGQ
jgi:1,4-dihydroxy-2-naphthoyl-CoA synthase